MSKVKDINAVDKEAVGEVERNAVTGSVGDEPAEKVLTVCEHYSYRSLNSLYCLELIPGMDVRADDSRRFARLVRGEPFGDPDWDESFDLIICEHSYQAYPDFDILSEELFRLLAPGGFCFISGSGYYSSNYSQ